MIERNSARQPKPKSTAPRPARGHPPPYPARALQSGAPAADRTPHAPTTIATATGAWAGSFASNYAHLRQTAHRLCRAGPVVGTMPPTALLHEVFLRLSRASPVIQDDRHLAALCIRIMRQILVDQARHRSSRKKKEASRPALPDRAHSREPSPEQVLALDEALRGLRELDPRKADVFALRFYCALTLDEVATNLGIARSTASEDWRFARAWLASQLQGGER